MISLAHRVFLTSAIFAWLIICAGTVEAQFNPPGQSDGGFSIVGAFDPAGADPATITAKFVEATADHPALLLVTARIQPDWHVYSVTQPRGRTGGPQRTKIELRASPRYRLLAPFRAHPEPNTRIDQEAWIGLELQEHSEEVTWYAPLALAAGLNPASLEVAGLVDMQVCKEQCVPVKAKFVARVAGQESRAQIQSILAHDPQLSSFVAPPAFNARNATLGSFQATDSEIRIDGRLEPASVRPGESARLVLTVTPSVGWHVYAHSDRDDQPGSKPTLIAFDSIWGLSAGQPLTEAPITSDSSVPNFPTMRYHEGEVTWTVDIDVPKDAEPGEYSLGGVFAYMACKDLAGGVCELPKAARLEARLIVGESSDPTSSIPIAFAPTTYREAAIIAAAWADMREGQPAKSLKADAAPVDPDVPGMSSVSNYDLSRIRVADEGGSLASFIGFAFLGGLILNLMPCVLPVIGLKVMSFVQQAGKSRSHALALNLWYAAGIASVFLILGGLAAWIGLSWGAQFGDTTFNVVIAVVVFAMALSLLGVWEVPIPGFFGTGAIQEVAAKEGPSGAFMKGVVTTVLATPCGAPYLTPAIAWAIGQPTETTLAVFASVGIGMASPYLLIGLFPELLRFLPKPGRWMEIFKQLSGFVLLLTVVFILSFMEPAAVVPTILLLVGVGMACWLFSRTPMSAEIGARARTWTLAGLVLLLSAGASFGWLYPDVMWPRYGGIRAAAKEGWDPFTLSRLQRVAVESGRTVLVDFSADWCFTCKVLEAAELHTAPVEQAIEQVGAIKMYADFTDYPDEIDDTIKALKSSGVPVIAIFPGDRPYEPIVFRGGYTKARIVEALHMARRRDGQTSARPPVSQAMATAVSPN